LVANRPNEGPVGPRLASEVGPGMMLEEVIFQTSYIPPN
jgi:hypothetical protein